MTVVVLVVAQGTNAMCCFGVCKLASCMDDEIRAFPGIIVQSVCHLDPSQCIVNVP